jgi:hypothetical protein
VIYEESGVDIEQLWEVIKLEVTDKDYPVETAFFFAWVKRHNPSNKAVAVFVENGRKLEAINKLMQLCNIERSDITWKAEETTQAGHYSDKDYKGRGKTTPCKFFQKGRCYKGVHCTYLHEVDKGGYDEEESDDV